MTAIEVLATIFAVGVLVKCAVVTTNPALWMRASARLLAYPGAATVGYAALAAVVAYHVLGHLGIVEVAAVMLLTVLLMGVSAAPFARLLLGWGEEVLRLGVRKAWLALVLWGALAVWVLVAVLT